MEWLGTGFSITIGGLRLRVRIALEDAPEPARWAPPPANPPSWSPSTHASPSSEPTGRDIWMN
jgi:hypothetical protein